MTVHPRRIVPMRQRSGILGKSFSAAGRIARRLRGPALMLALIVSAALLGYTVWRFLEIRNQNALITQIKAGTDTGKANSQGQVQLARLNLLLMRDRFDEAQAIIDSARSTASQDVLADMLYNQANSNIRRAFAAIEQAKPDAAIPLTKLAKDNYREALRLKPGFWDAKHNFDVASRLMRDFPGYEQDGEEQPEGETKLWTDLPGVPRGSP